MRCGILGPVVVRDAGGRDAPVGGPGVRALLARLLIDAGRLVSVPLLIQELYGADPPAGAANALQSQVSRLRRALPDDLRLPRHPAGYRLAVDPEQVDVHRFTRLAAEGRQAVRAGEPVRAASVLREALALWRGPALADVTGAPFAAAHAARLAELRLAAAEDLAEVQLRLGDPAPVVTELPGLVAAHPLRERLRGLLMRALYRSGRPAEALATFADLRQRLADELGVDPSAELSTLHVAILRGDPVAAPAEPAASAVPAEPAASAEPAEPAASAEPAPAAPPPRLPSPLAPLLGREQELARLGRLLDEARLVTLIGPGGTGKTRLAIEAAAVRDRESWFIDLSRLTDGSEVLWATVAALGLRDTTLKATATAGGPDPVERLAAALADRPVLLVLDNCEHVIADAAALVERLLAAGPRLQVLATSREPLGLPGETLSPVGGLAVPPADGPLDEVAGYAAARLLRDRAARAAPGGLVDDPAAVRRICRALDGLPLAIELAAVRLRSLPVTEVAARLDDRFALLSRGSRAAQPRHRTLRAVIDWSWDLLDDGERALARRFSVFAGGATLAAVAQVCGEPVDVLSSLVDKSLVEVVDGRYRMLETVRAYAAEQLRAAGEVTATRCAHAAYFLELARQADRALRGPDQLTWLARMDAERDNLHLALRQAASRGDVRVALDLLSALVFYWWLRGLRGEAAMLAAEVSAVAGDRPPAGMVEEHTLAELMASLNTDDPARAERLPGVASAVYRLPQPPRQPFLLYLAAFVSGPPAGGADAVRELVAATGWTTGYDPWTRALTSVGDAIMLAGAGDLARAREQGQHALAQFRALGERWGTVNALSALGEIAVWQGQLTHATQIMGEALDVAGELGSLTDLAELLRVRADIRYRAGDPDGAARDYHRMVEVARRAGAPEQVAAGRLGLGLLAWCHGDGAEARRLAELALAECPTGWYVADEVRAGLHRLLTGR